MRDIDQIKYFPAVEKLSAILCKRTRNYDPQFFRIMTTYYLVKAASMMRCNILTMDRGSIPVSMYALNLSLSGTGKGHSTNIIEESVLAPFKRRFLERSFPMISEKNLAKLANKRAASKGTSGDTEFELIKDEFIAQGALAFSFDSATTAAIKQMRHKLLMANAGSMNLELDEVGSNLVGQTEVLTAFLELYDVGKLKQKLTKNTKENIRSEELDGRTPTNLMLFGTPTKLLDGGKTEEDFYSMLETGYARRCIFGYSKRVITPEEMTVDQVYQMYKDKTTDAYLDQLANQLLKLADPVNFHVELPMGEDVTKLDIEYEIVCLARAAKLSDYQEVQRAELTHRHFKCKKIAGAYAFVDGASEVGVEHYYNAIKLIEDSGTAFEQILNRDRNYVRLAKYIAEFQTELTHADIQQDLSFYKGGEAHRRDLLNMAIAWGYKNNVIIKRTYDGDIEFLSGESLPETDLSKLIFAYSQDQATGYINEEIAFDELHLLTQTKGFHFINHHLSVPRRREENCDKGFNTIVLDIDGTCSIASAKLLLAEYKFLLYTTKRSTPVKERFRIILPLSHTLSMGAEEFKLFMENVFQWMPFDSDSQTGQRARKWLSFDSYYEYHDGELLDALPFIPETKKSEERQKIVSGQTNLNNIERWFCNTTQLGSRNNQMLKYGMMLADSGLDIQDIQDKLLMFNSKLDPKLEEAEIFGTIMRSVSRKIHKLQSQP